MSQTFSINSKDNKYIISGKTLSYLGSLILYFISPNAKVLKQENFKEFLGIFSRAEWLDYIYLDDLLKEEFMEIFNAIANAYTYLLSLDESSRNEWIKQNTIYSHLDDLWSQIGIWHTYKNHKGEERENNMQNVLEDILDMMKTDVRFDQDLVEEKSHKEISETLKKDKENKSTDFELKSNDVVSTGEKIVKKSKTKTFLQKLFRK